jgi:hypothetical protein
MCAGAFALRQASDVSHALASMVIVGSLPGRGRKKPGDPVAIISYDERPSIQAICNDGT